MQTEETLRLNFDPSGLLYLSAASTLLHHQSVVCLTGVIKCCIISVS